MWENTFQSDKRCTQYLLPSPDIYLPCNPSMLWRQSLKRSQERKTDIPMSFLQYCISLLRKGYIPKLYLLMTRRILAGMACIGNYQPVNCRTDHMLCTILQY